MFKWGEVGCGYLPAFGEVWGSCPPQAKSELAPLCTMHKLGKKYMEKLEISPRDFMQNDDKYLENRCRQWDEKIWLEENNRKKTLEIYNLYKKEIKQENYYNEEKSLIRFKYRTNTLSLRHRIKEGDGTCRICENDLEDFSHFLLDCKGLEDERSQIYLLQRPRIENSNELIGRLIFQEYETYDNELYGLWRKRVRFLKQLDD